MRYLFAIFFLCSVAQALAQLPKPKSGSLERKLDFPSNFVEKRNIDVWLPEGYDGIKPFSVLYMHDGQMLYDSTLTWNKQAWDVDDIAQDLMKRELTVDFIVVGIWNAGTARHANYFPQKPFEQLSAAQRDTVISQLQSAGRTTDVFQPNSDDYLKSIVYEIMPWVEQNYRVKTGPQHTYIAGSSMGGLISWYALCEYPDIFGGAACLSTHWPGTFSLDNNPIPDAFIHYLSENLPSIDTHKIYFDCGDQTLDVMYPSIQKEVDALLITKGYIQEKNMLSLFFPGKDHSEQSWKERLHLPLTFLFGLN